MYNWTLKLVETDQPTDIVLYRAATTAKNMLGKVLIFDFDHFLVGVCWLTQNLSQQIC